MVAAGGDGRVAGVCGRAAAGCERMRVGAGSLGGAAAGAVLGGSGSEALAAAGTGIVAVGVGTGVATAGAVGVVAVAGDIAAMNDVGARIEAELSRLEKMEKYSESIRKNADGISDEVRKSQKALDLLLRKAQSTLRALDVEVYDEDGERETPISLRNSSFSTTTHALPDEGAVA